MLSPSITQSAVIGSFNGSSLPQLPADPVAANGQMQVDGTPVGSVTVGSSDSSIVVRISSSSV